MNPYPSTIATTPATSLLGKKEPPQFRWQVIPSALTFFGALLSSAISVLMIFACLEYINSDRYDQTRTWYWTFMEFSIVPVWIGTTVLLFFSGWAWTHRTPSQAIAFLLLGALLLFAGFAPRL